LGIVLKRHDLPNRSNCRVKPGIHDNALSFKIGYNSLVINVLLVHRFAFLGRQC